MEQTILKKKRSVILKMPILFFAFSSVFFALLGYLNAFVDIEKVYSGMGYDISLRAASVSDFFWILKQFFVVVLLIVCVLKLYPQTQFPVIPVIFGWIAIESLISFFRQIPLVIAGYGTTLETWLRDVPMAILFSLAALQALRGMKKKGILIIAIAAALFITISFDIRVCVHVIYYRAFHDVRLLQWVIDWLCGLLEEVTFYVALLLFCLKNPIPSVLPLASQKRRNVRRK